MGSFAIPAVLAGASLLGGLFGKKNKTEQKGSSTSTSAPTFAPEFMGLRDRLVQHALGQLGGGGGFNLANTITNSRLQGIGGAADAAGLGLKARLAASGIRGPAAGSALGALDAGRFGATVGAINDQPLLAHQFDQEGFANAMAALGLGRGTTTNTTSTGTMTGTEGGGIGGGFADLGEMLGFLAAHGMLGGMGKGNT